MVADRERFAIFEVPLSYPGVRDFVYTWPLGVRRWCEETLSRSVVYSSPETFAGFPCVMHVFRGALSTSLSHIGISEVSVPCEHWKMQIHKLVGTLGFLVLSPLYPPARESPDCSWSSSST